MPPRARSDDPWRRTTSARARQHHRCDGAAARAPNHALTPRKTKLVPARNNTAPTPSPRAPKITRFVFAQRLRRPDVLLKWERPRRPRDRGAAIAKEGRNFTKGRRRDARERLFISIGFLFRRTKRAGRGQGPRQGVCRRTTTKRVRRRRVYGGVRCLLKWRCGFQSTKGRARPARDTAP